jgi:hypothetical protein
MTTHQDALPDHHAFAARLRPIAAQLVAVLDDYFWDLPMIERDRLQFGQQDGEVLALTVTRSGVVWLGTVDFRAALQRAYLGASVDPSAPPTCFLRRDFTADELR